MILDSFASSAIRFALLWSRPAVSHSTTSTFRALAAWRASNNTAPGSAPSYCRTISHPARSAQISSWSAAAARKVSAAHSSTRLPCFFRLAAILPMEVVLPTPLTPMKMQTLGFVSSFIAVSPTSISAIRISRRPSRTASWLCRCSLRTLVRSFSTASVAASTPRSAMMRVSSNSSKKSSSASVNPENRLLVIFFSLSKKPIVNSFFHAVSRIF